MPIHQPTATIKTHTVVTIHHLN